MNQRQLTRALAAELGQSNQGTEAVVEALLRILHRSISKGESISLRNFGTLKPVIRGTRSYGLTDSSKPAAVQVKFRAADKLLDAIKANDPQVKIRKSRGRLPSGS